MEINHSPNNSNQIKHLEFINSIDLKPSETDFLKLFKIVDKPKFTEFSE